MTRIDGSLSLTAVGHGRTLDLSAPGVCTVLICLAQETQGDTAGVEAAVRQRWPSATDVLVAYVVDLRKVPSLFRKVAEGMLASEYKKAVEALEPGQDAWEYTMILPDWKAEVATALGLEDPSKRASAAVIASDGRLIGAVQASDREGLVQLIDAELNENHGA
jgi:hypothetical protein